MASASGRILTAADVKVLSQRSDLHGAMRLGTHILMLAGSGWLVWRSGPWTLLPVMLLGIVQSTLFAPIHETIPLTAFRARRANAVVGWLVACPSLQNWHFYTAFDLAHHRQTQDPAHGPELALIPPSTLDATVWRVLALPCWRTRLQVAWARLRGDLSAYRFIPERAVPCVIRSLRAMCAVLLAGSILAMALVGWWAPLIFWIGPQLLGQPFLRLYLLTEHTLCAMDDNGLTNTRTTLTNGAMRLLMWNMPFHTEHHLYPSIPFHRLPDARAAMRACLGVLERGYARRRVGYVRTLRP